MDTADQQVITGNIQMRPLRDMSHVKMLRGTPLFVYSGLGGDAAELEEKETVLPLVTLNQELFRACVAQHLRGSDRHARNMPSWYRYVPFPELTPDHVRDTLRCAGMVYSNDEPDKVQAVRAITNQLGGEMDLVPNYWGEKVAKGQMVGFAAKFVHHSYTLDQDGGKHPTHNVPFLRMMPVIEASYSEFNAKMKIPISSAPYRNRPSVCLDWSRIPDPTTDDWQTTIREVGSKEIAFKGMEVLWEGPYFRLGMIEDINNAPNEEYPTRAASDLENLFVQGHLTWNGELTLKDVSTVKIQVSQNPNTSWKLR